MTFSITLSLLKRHGKSVEKGPHFPSGPYSGHPSSLGESLHGSPWTANPALENSWSRCLFTAAEWAGAHLGFPSAEWLPLGHQLSLFFSGRQDTPIKCPLPMMSHMINLYKLKSGKVYFFKCMCAKSFQLCPTPCNPRDCSPLGSSVYGILQQEYWSGLPWRSPGNLPDPGIEAHISYVSCIGRRVLYQ